MLSNAYFLAKFRFDTAENEPAKNLQNFEKEIAQFPNFANHPHRSRPRPPTGQPWHKLGGADLELADLALALLEGLFFGLSQPAVPDVRGGSACTNYYVGSNSTI